MEVLKPNQALKAAAAELAKQHGLSQNKLALKVGYKPGYFSMVLNGKTQATKQFLDKLIAAGAGAVEGCCPTCGQKLPLTNVQAGVPAPNTANGTSGTHE